MCFIHIVQFNLAFLCNTKKRPCTDSSVTEVGLRPTDEKCTSLSRAQFLG